MPDVCKSNTDQESTTISRNIKHNIEWNDGVIGWIHACLKYLCLWNYLATPLSNGIEYIQTGVTK